MTAFIARIPAEAAPHFAAMRIETTARNEADMRHMLWCMLGKRASSEAVIEQVPKQPRSESDSKVTP